MLTASELPWLQQLERGDKRKGRVLTEDIDFIVLLDDAAGGSIFPDTGAAVEALVTRHVEAGETLELHRVIVTVVHLTVQHGRVRPRTRHAGVTLGAMTLLYTLHVKREAVRNSDKLQRADFPHKVS